MAFDYEALTNALVKICKATGRFDRGAAHEPMSAPGSGYTFSVISRGNRPITGSGLNSTSTRFVAVINIRTPVQFKVGPDADAVDVKLNQASDDIARRIVGDLDLEVLGIRSIDVRGIYGIDLGWNLGYLDQDGKWFRVSDLDVPVIINDTWVEAM